MTSKLHSSLSKLCDQHNDKFHEELFAKKKYHEKDEFIIQNFLLFFQGDGIKI